METVDILTIIMLVIATLSIAFAFVFGLIKFFKDNTPMYVQLVTMGIGCTLLSRIYYVVTYSCYGEFNNTFDVGFIGDLGFFLFLFSANYGQIDSLVDDRSDELKKYRIIPFASTALVLAFIIVVMFLSPLQLAGRIATCVVFAALGFAMYYNLKHFIIPDVELGITDCLRKYNLFALIVELLFLLFYTFEAFEWTTAELIAELIFIAIAPFFTPVLYKGVKKWSL